MHVERYAQGHQACVECVETRCFRCGEKKDGETCSNCQSEFVALLGQVLEDDDNEIKTPEDKVNGYAGGVMHFDVTEDGLDAARDVERLQGTYRETAALDGRFNGSTKGVRYCESCRVALPASGVCDLC